MATEPVDTSNSYVPCAVYTPPVGRLPILGKIRAEVDKLRMDIADTLNQINNRDSQTLAENSLLNQKAVTELSQTSDNIPAGSGMNISTDVQGIIEKQKNLFQKQTDGFDRDAEQKMAKIMVDTWSVRQTTDGATTSDAGLDGDDINAVLVKAKTGIGVV